ncbi:2,4-dichlorophenol hydroxylase [Hyphodiscus hymeniophilus]|uniref:2,4-dichlorophenol hydroxylase n=1 Tax=Hyphodiscus hymeniophilus TaxID=353542 RepID=A0A9P6VGH4_9HELO|nr:2,4-dichlorophenol hydroxylase [Hyphodiscus hymeniophilus]
MAPSYDDSQNQTAHEQCAIDIPVLIVGGGPAGLLQAYMLSQLGGSLPYERMDAEVLADTPTMIHNIPQPSFEELVASHLSLRKDTEIRKNHSFVTCEQNGEYVTTTIEDRQAEKEYKVRSKFVIGCDGAKSKVRKCLGVKCEGESSYETMMTIHFNANLRDVVGKNVGMLHWIMDPEVSGFIIGYDLDDNQVLICNFDSEKNPPDSWNNELCRRIVTAAIGASVDFEVLSYRPWTLSRKVAESYREGNVFVAGDAAHSFPPTGGLGLNSGLGDVHNLAYKIAAAVQGWGSSSLLDTYQSERRQIALVNSQQSVKNGQTIFRLLKAIGTEASSIEQAKENLHESLTDPARKLVIMKGVEEQREHFNNLGLHIGYVYGDLETPPSASLYIHSYRPGARLPHAWISSALLPQYSRDLPAIDSSYVKEFTVEEVERKQYSTLDLCRFDAFTVIIDKATSSYWHETLEVLRVKTSNAKWKSFKINLVTLGIDFELIPGARGTEWVKGLQLYHGTAVIVRPDQHILQSFPAHSTAEQVFKALVQHLGF